MQHEQGNQGATIIKEDNIELFVEGKAKIRTKYTEKNQKGELIENEVFYNPVQVYNRDITILAMQTYINIVKKQRGEKFDGVSIIDALSASGLRTIRFLKQLEGIRVAYANDLSPASHKLMKDNFDLNQLDQSKLKMTLEDANELIRNQKKNMAFDIIDLDPYGSVVPFLDAAVQGVKDGGLLCITCTDTKVTCGPDIQKCYYFYGTTRAKVFHFSENSIRIVLNTISSAASRHCKFIQPLMTFQSDFYVRVFVRVRKGKRQCAQTATKIGNVYNCNSCGNYTYQPFFHDKSNKKGIYAPSSIQLPSNICQVCSQKLFINGPIWLGEINSKDFIQQMQKQLAKQEDVKMELKTKKKIYGTLHAIIAEKELSKYPLGFNFDHMCKNAKATTPSRKILYSAVQSLGFEVAASYISPGVYKTNASLKVIYDIIKCWKLKGVGEDKYLYNVVEQFSLNLLKKQIQVKPDFQFKVIEKEKHVPHFMSMGKGLGPKGKPERKVLNEEGAQQKQIEVDQNGQPKKKVKTNDDKQ